MAKRKGRRKKYLPQTWMDRSVYSHSFVLVFLLSHFTDYINFQPTTKWKRGKESNKWGILRHAWEFCRFSISVMQCGGLSCSRILFVRKIHWENKIEKAKEREREDESEYFFFGILVMPHLHVIFVQSPFLGPFWSPFRDRRLKKLHMYCTVYTHTHTNIESTIWFACLVYV